jgi:hypothetical protein
MLSEDWPAAIAQSSVGESIRKEILHTVYRRSPPQRLCLSALLRVSAGVLLITKRLVSSFHTRDSIRYGISP